MRAGNLNRRQQSSGILVGINDALAAVEPFTKKLQKIPGESKAGRNRWNKLTISDC